MKTLINIELKSNEEYRENSGEIPIIPGKNYSVSVNFTGVYGSPNCGYFGIVFLNEKNLEIERKIKWLNNFSNKETQIELSFQGKTNKIILIYRINCETDFTSNSKYLITPLNELKLKEILKINENPQFSERLKELTNEEEAKLEENLVWVFGFARSGTSWLALQLLSFNSKSINELHIDKHLGAREDFIIDKYVRRYDHMKPIPSYFFSDKYKDTWIYYLRKLILNRIFAEVPSISKNIVIKEPGGGLGALDFFLQCLPKSKFVILLRDGRDVVDSFMDARKIDGFMTTFGETPVTNQNRIEYIKYHSQIWSKYIENLLQHSKNTQGFIYLLKYENLIKNTIDELVKLYKFLEIDISKEEIQKIVEKYDFNKIPENQKGSGKFHRSASPGNWKRNFSNEEINLMNTIMGNILKELDYL